MPPWEAGGRKWWHICLVLCALHKGTRPAVGATWTMAAPLFPISLDGLEGELGCRKDSLKRFLERCSLRKDIDYTTAKVCNSTFSCHGGHNRQTIFVRDQDVYDLIKSSYNLKHRYVPLIGGLSQVSTILMSIENQTIGFICSCLKGRVLLERQYAIGGYVVDLCFPESNLVVECDEIGHVDRCPEEEERREVCIKELGYHMIRFNPNSDNFDVSLVMREIISIVCPRPG